MSETAVGRGGASCNPPLLTSDGIHKIRGYSSTCICPQMIQLLFSEIQNKSWKKTKQKHKAAYNIYHILSWNTHGLYILEQIA